LSHDETPRLIPACIRDVDIAAHAMQNALPEENIPDIYF
jgi:hypothetical protein